MKRILLSFFIFIVIASPCGAQWKNIFFPNPLAFGQYATSFFASEQRGTLYRLYNGTRFVADTGFSPGGAACFGTIGNVLVVGANSIFRSNDNGASWTKGKDEQTGYAARPAHAFATLGRLIFAGCDSGVYASTDSGSYWSLFPGSPHGVTALTLVDTTLFAGTPSGVFVSSDEGQHWQATSMTYGVSGLVVVGPVILAATQGRAIFRSTDNGSNWANIDPGLFMSYISSIVTDGQYCFVGTGSPNGDGSYGDGKGVFMSTDSGQHWDTINYGLPQNTPTGSDDYLSVNALGVFDTLLFVGVWDGAGTDNRTYFRSIPEILRQKGDTEKGAVSEPVIASDSIVVYPNPASGVVTIRSAGTRILGVRVLNIMGTEVLTIPRGYNSELHLDVSQLPSGTYFLEVETMDGMILRKITRE